MLNVNYNFILTIQNVLLRFLKTLIAGKLVLPRKTNNEFEVVIKKNYLFSTLNFLKNHHLFNFKQLIEIAVIDKPALLYKVLIESTKHRFKTFQQEKIIKNMAIYKC